MTLVQRDMRVNVDKKEDFRTNLREHIEKMQKVADCNRFDFLNLLLLKSNCLMFLFQYNVHCISKQLEAFSCENSIVYFLNV